MMALGGIRLAAIGKSRIARFLAVGALGTAFSYGVYVVLLFMGLNYAVANVAALVAGVLFSFKTQGTFVFDNTDNRLLGRFAACWLVICGANVLFINRMMAIGLDGYTAGAVSVPGIAALSYLAQRLFVFRTGRATVPR